MFQIGMMNLEHIPVGTHKKIFLPQNFASVRMQPYFVPQSRKGGHRDVLRLIIEGFFIAASKPVLKDVAGPHLKSMIQHCVR